MHLFSQDVITFNLNKIDNKKLKFEFYHTPIIIHYCLNKNSESNNNNKKKNYTTNLL